MISPEYLSALASIGTLVVIIVTAIAALRQLRTMAHGNHVAALSEAIAQWDSEEVRVSREFVLRELPALLEDPAFRLQLETNPLVSDARRAQPAFNHFELLGSYVRFRLVDEEAALSVMAGLVRIFWKRASPAIAIMRRSGPVYENFEYFAMRASRYVAALPGGEGYPRGAPRMRIEDCWLAEDRARERIVE
ncbi:MAG TPA: hypothetical protein VFE70_07840 [Candidatus Elarobacter sp.]|nr:hypothetical protein [Candidatus Elarobacter sp.]